MNSPKFNQLIHTKNNERLLEAYSELYLSFIESLHRL